MLVIDHQQEIQNLLASVELEHLALKIDQETFKFMNAPLGEIYLIHHEIFDKLILEAKDKIEQALCVIIVGSNSKQSIDHSPVVDYIDLISSEKWVVKKRLNFLSQMEIQNLRVKSQFLTLSRDMEQILDNLETQVQKAKRVYTHNAPKRIEKFPNANVYTKYSAGIGTGSDFYDLHKFKHGILLYMSSTNSYLIANSMLSQFLALKKQDDFAIADLEKFIYLAQENVIKLNNNQKKMDVIFLIFNPVNLSLSVVTTGNFVLYSSVKGRLDQGLKSQSSIQKADWILNRGENIILGSSGVLSKLTKKSLFYRMDELLDQHKQMDVLDEMMIEISRNQKEVTEGEDLSAMLLEVKENAISKI